MPKWENDFDVKYKRGLYLCVISFQCELKFVTFVLSNREVSQFHWSGYRYEYQMLR